MKIRESELPVVIDNAWLAGVFDSDGSLTISKNNVKRKNVSYCGVAQLSWTNTKRVEQVFKSLVEKYGGSYCKVNSSASSYKNSKPYLKYCLTGRQIEVFLKDIEPHLILKRKQAKLILKLRKLKNEPRSNFRPRSRSVQKRYENYYILNKKLNSKNKPNKDL